MFGDGYKPYPVAQPAGTGLSEEHPAAEAEAYEKSKSERAKRQDEEDSWSPEEIIPDHAEAAMDMIAGTVLTAEQTKETGEDSFFWQSKITDSIFRRIYGKSYGENCSVPREDLRYLRMLHCDFDGNIRVGEMICNKSISDDVLRIFRELYKAGYPIEKMVLIDEYEADDNLSSSDNNTSCFNYRPVAGSSSLSLHAKGIAVDINPLYNPYVTQGGQKCAPANGSPYIDRSQDFDYKIDENDLCYKLFTEAGFSWGGLWPEPDYMHFSRSAAAR